MATRKELLAAVDALLPSISDRNFSGEDLTAYNENDVGAVEMPVRSTGARGPEQKF